MNGRRTGRTPLYSRSERPAPAGAGMSAGSAGPAAGGGPPGVTPGQPSPRATPAGAPTAAASAPAATGRRRFPAGSRAGVLGALVGVAAAVGLTLLLRPSGPVITQKDIDAAVLHTLQTQQLPSPSAQAYESIAPSVVRVTGKAHGQPVRPGGDKSPSARPTTPDAPDDEDGTSVGSGVVIVDTGIILTNLHVVAGSARVMVTFADGTESEASIVNVMPEQDLAVLRAHRIPDDLKAATMRSTADLRPGDRVTAVGFPFGIGPTVSSGVVSGLKREFRSPEGQQSLSNLIQFDAMANPGSSGGPLVTDDGAVVGIVTAIYNPVQQRFFVGIGFAVPIESAAGGAGLPPF